MTGALAETTFNFFGKMKYMKLYDGDARHPGTAVRDRARRAGLGDAARHASTRRAFLVVMVAMDLTTAGRALAAFPATVLVGFAFGAVGMALSTFMRSWQDFDLMAPAQFALFLFSGTFVPAEAYPAVLRWVVEVTPLYRSVDLIRGITTGARRLGCRLVDVGYLLASCRRRPGRRRPADGGPALQVSCAPSLQVSCAVAGQGLDPGHGGHPPGLSHACTARREPHDGAPPQVRRFG